MNFYILTLFPEMVMDGLNTSIIGRAVKNGLLSIEAVNIRDFAQNKHGLWMITLMAAVRVYLCRQHQFTELMSIFVKKSVKNPE